ncbi:nicotinate-nucleotide pyrophosphorylase [carboxylating] [Alteromonadaceae bacterium Bs31]|nr:nicotinate-nucleotide pyrophosphorylase [carboxylating] [Alteromonadaceae bacterium Bs31]
MNITLEQIRDDIQRAVTSALAEDVGSGDISAQLIAADKTDRAEIITREACVVCGIAWFDEVFSQLGGISDIEWHVKDGDTVDANTTLVSLQGNTRTLLTGERTAMNFLQFLSGIATKASHYATLVKGTNIKILDTRKTIPGLRTAQKYAVNCGGCHNHRIGLFDAYLIKENHILACGGIREAIEMARNNQPGKAVEVEVESIAELKLALETGVDIVMLDNFDEEMLADAGKMERTAKYEVSGNVTLDKMESLTKANIDYISIGDLTKNINALDLSMRIR